MILKKFAGKCSKVMALAVAIFIMAAIPAGASHQCCQKTGETAKSEKMDCHSSKTTKAETGKSCCLDVACAKCQSNPATITTYIENLAASSSIKLLASEHILISHQSNTPEHPPKTI